MILKSLVNSSKLERLFLNNNDINSQAGDSLCDFIARVKNLKEIRISNNTLEDYGGLRLAEGMLEN